MTSKRQGILLAVLLVALVGVSAYQYAGWTDNAPGGSVATAPSHASQRTPAQAGGAVPAVRLDVLQAARKEPLAAGTGRDVFKFQSKAPAPPLTPVASTPPGTGGVPGAPGGGPPAPPPPPPIPLKFMGIVQAADQKLAVLTEETTKDVFYGREGDVIEGRYRILRIGVESIDMAYTDGRGRQTIRLSGQ